MKRSTRAGVSVVAGFIAFVAATGWLGWREGIYLHGCQCSRYGWSAAWRVGLIPVILAAIVIVIGIVVAWVQDGGDG